MTDMTDPFIRAWSFVVVFVPSVIVIFGSLSVALQRLHLLWLVEELSPSPVDQLSEASWMSAWFIGSCLSRSFHFVSASPAGACSIMCISPHLICMFFMYIADRVYVGLCMSIHVYISPCVCSFYAISSSCACSLMCMPLPVYIAQGKFSLLLNSLQCVSLMYHMYVSIWYSWLLFKLQTSLQIWFRNCLDQALSVEFKFYL